MSKRRTMPNSEAARLAEELERTKALMRMSDDMPECIKTILQMQYQYLMEEIERCE